MGTGSGQAEKLRKDGNLYFNKGRYRAAIDAYTEAIALCPNVAILWTNRALAHRRRNEWAEVESDSRRGIELDPNLFKAHYMLGLALLQREEYDEGAKELQRALDLTRCAESNDYFMEEILKELATAKYMKWEHESIERSWELQSLKQDCETALKEKHFLDNDETVSTSLRQQLDTLGNVFEKAIEEDVPTEVPNYLCCRITLDILRDPVITPSGITYEKEMILKHLQKVGRFDPVTREKLHPWQLVPNLAIKGAVEAFLEKHGWAYKMG